MTEPTDETTTVTPRRRNRLAVTAYWLSIIGILPPLSLVMGLMAWRQIEHEQGTNQDRQMAVASVIISILATVLLVILIFVIIWMMQFWGQIKAMFGG